MKTVYYISLSLFISVFFLLRTTNAQENEKSNEISVAIGAGSIQEFTTMLGEAFASSIKGQKLEESSGTGAIAVSYNHFTSAKFSYGATLVWENLKSTYSNPTEKIEWNVIAIMANGKYYYVARPAFKLYSGLAAGYAVFKGEAASSNYTNGAFAFQATPIGGRLGNTLGIFMELGFGYEGLAKIGVSVRF